MFCINCGAELRDSGNFCQECGKVISGVLGDDKVDLHIVELKEVSKPNSNTSLVVLVVVVASITMMGLLSTLAIVALNSARQKSRDSKRVADVKQIQTALELYYVDNDQYPLATAPVVLGFDLSKSLCTGGFKSACTFGLTTYMGILPAAADPYDGDCTAANNEYVYSATQGSYYSLKFCLGGPVGDINAGPRTAGPNGIR